MSSDVGHGWLVQVTAILLLSACGGSEAQCGGVACHGPKGLPCRCGTPGDSSDAGASNEGGGFAGGSAGGLPKCSDTPTQLVSADELFVADAGTGGISAAMDLAVSATDLYVAVNYAGAPGGETGALLRVALPSGHPVAVAAIEGTEQALLVVGDYVVLAVSQSYSSAGSSGQIVRLDLDGGNRTVLASGRIPRSSLFGPAGILSTDGRYVYFAAEDGVKSVPLKGGAVRALAPNTGSLAVVGPNLVIADGSAEAIVSVPTGGGAVTTLADHLVGTLGPVLSCGDEICWAGAVEVPPSQEGTGTIMKLATGSGSAPTTFASSSGLYIVQRMLFDGTDFFATMGADVSPGALARVSGDGGSLMSLGSGFGLAIDDHCLYAADAFAGVRSVAKTFRGTLP